MKKPMKKVCLYLIVISALLIGNNCYATASPETIINLLKNPGFETLDDTMPAQWQTNGWITDGSVTKFHIDTNRPHSGGFYAVIENYVENDSRFIQRVEVKPETVYRISGWIKTENVGTENTGANFTILQDYYTDHSDDVIGTSDWIYVELYILTKKEQKDLLFAARLGGFGEVNTGKACFDDIEFAEIGALPAGEELSKSKLAGKHISDLASNTGGRQVSKSRTSKGGDKTNNKKIQMPTKPGEQVRITSLPFEITMIFAFMFLILAVCMYYFFFKRENLIKAKDDTIHYILLIALAVGLVSRIFIAFTFEGYHNDTESFKAWAVRSSTYPLNEFYDPRLFADYPPGYIYVLAFIGHIGRLLNLDYNSALYIMLLKLPGILADIGAAYLIFFIAKKKLNVKTAFALSILYAYNPALQFTSSFWGQMDSIPALLVLIIILCIIKRRLWLAGLILGVTILVKLQAGVLFFILLFALIDALIKKKDWKSWILAPLAGLSVFTLIIIPFIPRDSNIFWIFDLVKRTMTQYPYASVNAFNLMALFGGNWQPLDSPFLLLNYSTWGYIFGVLILAFITVLYFRMKDDSKNFFVTFAFYILVFMLLPAMHERYVFSALLVSLMCFIYTNRKELLILYIGFSTTFYINIVYVLDFFLRSAAGDKNAYIFAWDPVEVIIGILNLALLGLLIKLGVEYILPKKMTGEQLKNSNQNHNRKYNHGKLRAR